MQQEYKKQVNLSLEDQFDEEDISERRLWLNEDIDSCVIGTIVFSILRYNRLDEENGVPEDKRKPIYLYINSPGGSVSDGYGLVDAIITSKTPVYTINLAMCASMGFLIFIAGHKRFSMPHAQFLMHDGSTSGWDSTAKMKDRMEFETIQLEEMTKKYILSRTRISENLYKEKYRCEWYFLPEEAKENGVVDAIVGQDCEMKDVCGIYTAKRAC